MQTISAADWELKEIAKAGSYNIRCFVESPRKHGKEKPVKRMGAFDLFNLFTADIIRSKKVFTR